MQQKTILMMLLTIGILSSLLSCNKGHIDKALYQELHYINNSNHDLSITVFNKIDNNFIDTTYSIVARDNFFQEFELIFGDISGIISECDSVTVKFGEERISIFIPDAVSSYNILNYNNYEFLEKSENRRSYTYTFTEADYENADEL